MIQARVRSTTSRRGQDFEGVQVIGTFHHLEGELERCLGSGDELAGIATVGPGEPDLGERLAPVMSGRGIEFD